MASPKRTPSARTFSFQPCVFSPWSGAQRQQRINTRASAYTDGSGTVAKPKRAASRHTLTALFPLTSASKSAAAQSSPSRRLHVCAALAMLRIQRVSGDAAGQRLLAARRLRSLCVAACCFRLRVHGSAGNSQQQQSRLCHTSTSFARIKASVCRSGGRSDANEQPSLWT